jgi:quercetin dioxygenase-like cupin family protein/pyrroloquinoline quinone (PQQ) biosynthesis protein C
MLLPPMPSPALVAPGDALAALRALRDAHPFWDNPLLVDLRAGALDLAALREVFGQYAAWSRAFTRCLAAYMARCEDDQARARLIENLWDEGGGADPSRRHSLLFDQFLEYGLGLQPAALVFDAETRAFVDANIAGASAGDPVAAAAFLSLGVEGIVARLYGDFVVGLRAAGVDEAWLTFFHAHIECDDAHAATLEEILTAQGGAPGFEASARAGMLAALELRDRFFRHLHTRLARRRLAPLLERIVDRVPLGAEAAPEAFVHRAGAAMTRVYANTHLRLGIDFTVERLSFPDAQAMDPRVVRIRPGMANERHRHAHESLFVVLEGRGEVLIGDAWQVITAGDVAFVPRWIFHQTRNTSYGRDLVVLAITDFGLTSAVLGDYDRRTRLALAGADAGPSGEPCRTEVTAPAVAQTTEASPMRATGP